MKAKTESAVAADRIDCGTITIISGCFRLKDAG
jgi:hypothetical protein